jgi:hypothetical protein
MNANIFKFVNSQKRDHASNKKNFDKLNDRNKINLNPTITKDNNKTNKNPSLKITTKISTRYS